MRIWVSNGRYLRILFLQDQSHHFQTIMESKYRIKHIFNVKKCNFEICLILIPCLLDSNVYFSLSNLPVLKIHVRLCCCQGLQPQKFLQKMCAPCCTINEMQIAATISLHSHFVTPRFPKVPFPCAVNFIFLLFDSLLDDFGNTFSSV